MAERLNIHYLKLFFMLRSRLKKEMDRLALEFSSSITHDENIFYYDILVDIAHVLTLRKSGYLTDDETREILKALKEIDYSRLKGYEDVHEAIESEVTKITKAGLKMHTARSRNDEVATCLRLFARDNLLYLAEGIIRLLETILKLAKENNNIMPGFTHLQYAQPTRLSHHLIAYYDMINRDLDRVVEAYFRVNKCPLGSAAFASTSYKIDRYYSAKLLGFNSLVENSEDAVASRDFLIESIFVCTSLMLSLSRIAEEIVLWSSEFDFVDLPDEFASTSSIMPQKKNPDIAELIRANSGRLIGNLTAVMSVYKALPFSYNRDFQEMNEVLYDSLKRARTAVEVMNGMLSKIKFKKDVMKEKANKGFSFATDLADFLVKNFKIPFRIAHRIVGNSIAEGFSVEKLKEVARRYGYEIELDKNVLESLEAEKIVEKRRVIGGTSLNEVNRMIKERERDLKIKKYLIKRELKRIKRAIESLYNEAKRFGVDFHDREEG